MVLAVALVLVSSLAAAAPRQQVAGRAIVRLAAAGTEALVEKTSGVALRPVRPLLLGWSLYQVRPAGDAKAAPTEDDTAALIRRLAADPGVVGAVADRWYRPFATATDPHVDLQWDLGALGMEAAWDVTTGTADQRVGVVDTGIIRQHQELSSKDQAGYDFISDTDIANDGDGRDADYNDPGDGADCGQGFEPSSFHGTHVSGTILAATNNSAGIAGLNWGARLVTVRAMGRCGGSLSDILEGAAWLAGMAVQGVPALGGDQVSVMNLSLGGYGACSSYEQEVIDAINARGVVFVVASGNDGGAVGSPANCSGAVAVAAHGPGSTRPLTAYSSFGSEIGIVAPGGDMSQGERNGILSALGPGTNEYAYYEGTSMAAPHVTGIISLVQAVRPAATRAEIVSLMQQTGAACANCQGKVAVRADTLLAAVAGGGSSTSSSSSSSSSGGGTTPPTGTDPFEPNNSWDAGAAISCGSAVSAHAASGDEDWFRLSVPAGTVLHVVLDGVGSAGDLDLYLTRSPYSAGIVARSESETAHETADYTAMGGAVGILVRPYDSATGDYTLRLDCQLPAGSTPLPEDGSEPNNDFASASPVNCGAGVDGVSAPGNQDWFALTAAAGTVIEGTLTSDGPDLGLQMAAGPGQGGIVAQSSGTARTVRYTSQGARLALLVTPGAASATYRLDVRCTPAGANPGGTPPAEDALEPNNDPTQAAGLACGTTTALVAHDRDFFRLDIRDKDDLVVILETSAGVHAWLLDGAGTEVLQDNLVAAGASSELRANNLAGGVYLVGVDPEAAGAAYTLTVQCRPHAPDEATAGCSSAGGGLPPALCVAVAAFLGRRRRR
ncbi:MAG: S8 family serine peptidase [Deltaproteobacteria bacterium]|nr:S8 family serine peptidase [Deltaproteobacteria bacterium]